jgi:hypothetical protein
MITAVKKGRTNYMGFTWHSILVDGVAMIEKYHAVDQQHAIAMYNQSKR